MPVDQAAAALQVVQDYCRWHVFPSTTETLTLDGPYQFVLMLPSLLVTDVTTVIEDGTTLVEGADYEWSEIGILRRLGDTPWTGKLRGLSVTLTHGYASEPDALAAVVERVAARGSSDGGTVRQVGQVAYATTRDGVGVGGTLTAADKAQLAPYRIPLGT